MPNDIQVDVAARVRAAGVAGDARLRMSPTDARRLIAGFQGVDADADNVDALDRYPPIDDGHGVIRYAVDDAMPRGAGLAVDASGTETPVSLDGLTS